MDQINSQQPILPTEAVLVSRGVLQPFQCPTCSKRFTRYENLKRHAAVHEEGNSFTCTHCTTTFSRRDLCRRHIKKKHPEHQESASPRLRRNTTASSTGDGDDDPLNDGDDIAMGNQEGPSRDLGVTSAMPGIGNASSSQALHSGGIESMQDLNKFFSPMSSTFPLDSISMAAPVHTTLGHFDFGDFGGSSLLDQSSAGMMPMDSFAPASYTSTSTTPQISPPPITSGENDPISPSQLALGLDLFHTHVASFIPFIHRPTFDPSNLTEPVLFGLLSVSLAYNPDRLEGQTLSNRCFKHAKRLLDVNENRLYSPVVRVQALSLLQMYAIMYSCGNDTAHGLRMRNKTIEIIRREGMMDPLPCKAGQMLDLEALWLHFVRAEVHKRTLYFFYQLDATWYHLLSIPRTVSHLEVKHNIPCVEMLWSAETASVWAHRNLIHPDNKDSSRFIQSIRTWMAPNTSATTVNCSYSALLILLYLHTGVREVSGWSTMTGRICFERFEAFNSALMALESVVCSKPPDGAFAVDAEATWRVTMIELLLWNPSHTSGLVETSLDGAVVSATTLSAAQSVVFTPQVAEMLDPHVVWFLQFLDRTGESPLEPPWVTMYAFKAVLVAWQLVRAGITECIGKLGLADASEFATWIRRVFVNRGSTGVGRLIIRSLSELGK